MCSVFLYLDSFLVIHPSQNLSDVLDRTVNIYGDDETFFDDKNCQTLPPKMFVFDQLPFLWFTQAPFNSFYIMSSLVTTRRL